MSEMASPTTARSQENFYTDPDVREQVQERLLSFPFGGFSAIRELYAAVPDEHGFAIPDEGGWIIVKEQPLTAIPDPPLYSIWRARPIYYGREMKVVAGGRRRKLSWPFLKARIATEHGDLDLHPGEFVPTDLSKWMEFIGEGVEINFLGPEPDELIDRLFYLRAHGLDRAAATALILPELEENNYCYLTIDLEGEA